MLSPKQLLESQINELQGRMDNLNAKLTSVLKTGTELKLNIERLHGRGADKALIDQRTQQLKDTELQKENILKKLKAVEQQMAKKEKELEKVIQ